MAIHGSDRLTGWPLSFSADGAVLAYRFVESKGRRGCVVVNGREGPTFDAVGMPHLSRDGRVIAYWAENLDGHFIRVGNRDIWRRRRPDPMLAE